MLLLFFFSELAGPPLPGKCLTCIIIIAGFIILELSNCKQKIKKEELLESTFFFKFTCQALLLCLID